MTTMYAGAASLAAALLLGVAAHAAQAAGLSSPLTPSADSLVTKVQGIREGGGGGPSAGGGAGRSDSGGGGGFTSGGGRGSGGSGGVTIERGGGGDRGFASRSGRSEGGSATRSGDRDRVVGSGRWEGRSDHRGRHRHTRHRGVRIFLGPGYGYYDGDYDYSCEWLRRRAIATGSRYWWRRFRECVY